MGIGKKSILLIRLKEWGKQENESFEERKKMVFRKEREQNGCLGLFCKICQHIFYHAILRVERESLMERKSSLW